MLPISTTKSKTKGEEGKCDEHDFSDWNWNQGLSVQDEQVSCWCNQTLDANKSQHDLKFDLSLRVSRKQWQSLVYSRQRWSIATWSIWVQRYEEGEAIWADVAFYGENWCVPETDCDQSKLGSPLSPLPVSSAGTANQPLMCRSTFVKCPSWVLKLPTNAHFGVTEINPSRTHLLL